MIVDLNLIKELIKVNEATVGPSEETKKLAEAVELIEHVAKTAELSVDSVVDKLKSLGIITPEGMSQTPMSSSWSIHVNEFVTKEN